MGINYETFYLNISLGVIGNSCVVSKKKLPVQKGTLRVGKLTFSVYVTLVRLGPHHRRFTIVA